jgi:hypothetical protein
MDTTAKTQVLQLRPDARTAVGLTACLMDYSNLPHELLLGLVDVSARHKNHCLKPAKLGTSFEQETLADAPE